MFSYYTKPVLKSLYLGNVLTVVSDRKIAVDGNNDGIIDYFSSEILTANDYYSFGFEMKGRSVNSGTSYAYGFNGKRKDPEGLGGGGATYDYGFRIYNPELGKFLSRDPLTSSYPWFTPYQYAGNKPINSIDIDGLEDFEVVIKPVATSAKLQQLFVTKVMEHNKVSDPAFGFGGVQYTVYDNDGNVMSSTRQADFNPNSAEKNYMDSQITFYNDKSATGVAQTGTPRNVMAPTERTSTGEMKSENNGKYIGNNTQLTGRLSFRYQTDILFKTDKSKLTEATLQSGTYEGAMADLDNLSNILTTGIIIGTKPNNSIWNVNVRGWKLQVNGKTDSSPSNYRGCGNPCLGQDRAKSVLEKLRTNGVTQPATTTNQESSGPVDSNDRKATVDIVPN